MYTSVLIGADGSAGAQVAVEVGGAVAVAVDIPATVVSVWRTDLEVPGSSQRAWAGFTTKAADIDLGELGVSRVEMIERKGAPADVLIDIAGEHPDSVLVVGAEGLRSASSRVTASPANRLSHHSPVDVLFAYRVPQRWSTVALTTDGSPTSEIAVRRGLSLVAALGAQPTLVTAAKTADEGERVLDEVAEHLGIADVGRDVLIGGVSTLVDSASRYDLMVLGNRGMSGVGRVLGSTANTITHRAETNLLLVNSTQV